MKLIDKISFLTLKGELFKIYKGKNLLIIILTCLVPAIIYKFIKLSKLTQIYYLSNSIEKKISFFEFALEFDTQTMFTQSYLIVVCVTLILFENDKKGTGFMNLPILPICNFNFYITKLITLFIVILLLLVLVYVPNFYISSYFYDLKILPNYFTNYYYYFSILLLIIFFSNVYLIFINRVYLFLSFCGIFLLFPSFLNPFNIMNNLVSDYENLKIIEMVILIVSITISFLLNKKNIYG